MFVMSVQLHKSELCCIMKFVEGMIQETVRLLPDGTRLNCGDGVDWHI